MRSPSKMPAVTRRNQDQQMHRAQQLHRDLQLHRDQQVQQDQQIHANIPNSRPSRGPEYPIIDTSLLKEAKTIFITTGRCVHTERKAATFEFVWSIGDLFKLSQVQDILSSPTFSRQPNDGIFWKIEAIRGNEILPTGSKQLLSIWLCPQFTPIINVQAVSVRGNIYTSKNGCLKPHCAVISHDIRLFNPCGQLHLRDLYIDRLEPGICLEVNVKIEHYLGVEHYDNRWSIGSEYSDQAKFFERVYTDCEFTDMKINVQDVQFEAHKAILASRSPYFKAAFLHDMIESRTNSIELKDFSPEVIECMLKFIYTSKMPLELKRSDQMREVDIHLASELLRAADMYQVEDLRAASEHFLHKFIYQGAVLQVLEVAHNLSCHDLEGRALEYVQRNRDELFKTNEWETFVQSNPELVAKFFKSLRLRDS